MGQKINPISYRIGITKNWQSRWFFPSKGNDATRGRYPYAKFLKEDEAIRRIVKKRIALAGIAGLVIERTSNLVRVTAKVARPGFVIGQGGKGIEQLSKDLEKAVRELRGTTVKSGKSLVSINVEELKRTDTSAAHIAQQMAWDLEKRIPFRRTMRKYIEQAMQDRNVKGIKVMMGGRLDGAEIARHETLRKGELPLQTLRADIDYGTATAFTVFGTVGIKVWISHGEVVVHHGAPVRAPEAHAPQFRGTRREAPRRMTERKVVTPQTPQQ
jgi:small subunit ribosomal protein S3